MEDFSGLSVNVRKLLEQSEAKKRRESVEHDQKLIRLEEAHNELAHQISGRSDQWCICKWAETARRIKGREKEIQRSDQKLRKLLRYESYAEGAPPPPPPPPNEFTHKISIQSMVCLNVEISWPIRSQETAGIQRSVPKA